MKNITEPIDGGSNNENIETSTQTYNPFLSHFRKYLFNFY